jgi:hypothetical protein
VRSDIAENDGSRTVTIEARDESQIREWVEGQRAQGLNVRGIQRESRQRFLSAPGHFSWSFGGEDAFREIARIALNLLATRNPVAARLPKLGPLKSWIRGERERAPGEGPYVWYQDGAVTLPTCPFLFGHRVALRLDNRSGDVDAVITFFNSIEYLVSFGPVDAPIDDLVIFEIDPLAESPPHDLRIMPLDIGVFPPVMARPGSSAVTKVHAARLDASIRVLMERIDERQQRNLLAPVCEQFNASRLLAEEERLSAIAAAATQCRGHILGLLRYASTKLGALATEPFAKLVADAFAFVIASDKAASDGLSASAREFLALAERALIEAIAAELTAAPLSVDRTIMLFRGGAGLEVVTRAVLAPVLDALKAQVAYGVAPPR